MRTAVKAIFALIVIGSALGASHQVFSQETPVEQPPQHLAGTGLYSDLPRKIVSPGVLPYSPQYPLWSDGAKKHRWISLPPGAKIDVSNPDDWEFPVGTRIWKEFAFDRRVETRFMKRLASGVWLFATYVWN